MVRLLVPILAVALLSGSSPASTRPMDAYLRMESPDGWRRTDTVILGDPVTMFHNRSDKITVQLFGGESSRFPTMESFFESYEARDIDGNHARKQGYLRVSGRKLPLLIRRYDSDASEPGAPPGYDEPERFLEEFFVAKSAGRFLVVSFSRPETSKSDSRPAWLRFVKSLGVKTRSPKFK